MKIELNKTFTGQTVLDIIPEPKDNKWELAEFHRFIEKARKSNLYIDLTNEPTKGDVVRISINEYENK